jgi:hypothetical protein
MFVVGLITGITLGIIAIFILLVFQGVKKLDGDR